MHNREKRKPNPRRSETPQPSTTSRSSAIRPPPRNADDRSRTKDRVDLGASAPFLGKKFTVGAVDDPHEREADRAAEQVMRFLEGARASSRALKINASDGPNPGIQRQFTPVPTFASTSPAIARNGNSGRIGASGGPLSPAIARGIENAGGGEALPAETLFGFNAAFRADFSRVRVHADDRAEKLNEQLSSRAFSVGPDLFFKRSEYRPQTYAGQKLLAHELAHVRQHQKHPGLRRMVRRYYWRGPDGSVQWIDGDPDHEVKRTLDVDDDRVPGRGYIYEKAVPAADEPDDRDRRGAKRKTPTIRPTPVKKRRKLDDEESYSGTDEDEDEGLLNYTKHRPEKLNGTLVNNKLHQDELANARARLDADAKTIQGTFTGSRAGAHTIATSIERRDGKLRRYVTYNGQLLGRAARRKAHELGYHYRRQPQMHAEAGIAFRHRHFANRYRHVDMAVDKPHCAVCDAVLTSTHGAGYATQTAKSRAHFRNYYLADRDKKGKKSQEYFEEIRKSHGYDEKGKKERLCELCQSSDEESDESSHDDE